MSRLATLEQTARYLGRTPRTVRNYISRGYFPAYRRPAKHGLLIDLDDVDNAMQKLPARKARSAEGAYGPNATIITLATQVEVVEP